MFGRDRVKKWFCCCPDYSHVLNDIYAKLACLEETILKKDKRIMDLLDQLTALVTEMAEDTLVLGDEVGVAVDLLTELAKRHDDADLQEVVVKLTAIRDAVDLSKDKLKAGVDAVSSSGGDVTE